VSGGRDGITGMIVDGGGFFAADSARFEAVPPMNTIEYGKPSQGINRAMYGGEPTSTEPTERHGHGETAAAADVSKDTEGSRNGGSAGAARRSRGWRRRKQDKEDEGEGARGK
jgi:hypothetical protein